MAQVGTIPDAAALNKAAPVDPFPSVVPKPPLNAADKLKIATYLHDFQVAGGAPSDSVQSYLKMSDKELLGFYSHTHGSNPKNLQPGNPTGIPGISSVADFLSLLTKPETWIRVAEVTIGVLLIGVAVAKFTHQTNIVTKVLKDSPKAAPAKAVKVAPAKAVKAAPAPDYNPRHSNAYQGKHR